MYQDTSNENLKKVNCIQHSSQLNGRFRVLFKDEIFWNGIGSWVLAMFFSSVLIRLITIHFITF